MGYKTEITASGEECPCGAGAYNRFAICSQEKTDGLNLHYDICSRCGFEVYAHCGGAVPKMEQFIEWGRCPVDKHLAARLVGERILNGVTWVIALGLIAAVGTIIYWRIQ